MIKLLQTDQTGIVSDTIKRNKKTA